MEDEIIGTIINLSKKMGYVGSDLQKMYNDLKVAYINETTDEVVYYRNFSSDELARIMIKSYTKLSRIIKDLEPKI